MMHTLESINNFLQVRDALATAGQPSMRELETLADAGYQVVINLGLHGTEYALGNEQVWVAPIGTSLANARPIGFQCRREMVAEGWT